MARAPLQFGKGSWVSGHALGLCLINHKRKLYYIHTPKCASMWTRNYLSLLGHNDTRDIWEPGNFTIDDTDSYRPFVILRDPYERFLSACPLDDSLESQINNNGADAIFNNFENIIKDEHTAPQVDFLEGLDLNEIEYFYCDNTLSRRLKHFFDCLKFDPSIQAPPKINEHSTSFDHLKVIDLWKSLLSQDKYFEIFKTHYSADYDLISKVPFYNYDER